MYKSKESEMLELLRRDDSEMLLSGSEGEEDSDEMSDDPDLEDDNADADDDEKSKKEDGDADGDKEESVETLKRRVANLEAERGRNVEKRKTAEARAKKAEEELAALKKSGAGDDEVKKTLDNLTQENEGLHAKVADMALENAFLKDNTFKWQDPKAALKLADLADVEIDDDGSVHGLGSALEKLSKSSPWLVRKEEEDDKGDDDGKKKPPPKKSGGPSGSTKDRQKSSSAERAKKYAAKYPGLRR